jgi:hypothetical protein
METTAMQAWIARQNISLMTKRLEDAKPKDNVIEMGRQLAEQKEILRRLEPSSG